MITCFIRTTHDLFVNYLVLFANIRVFSQKKAFIRKLEITTGFFQF